MFSCGWQRPKPQNLSAKASPGYMLWFWGVFFCVFWVCFFDFNGVGKVTPKVNLGKSLRWQPDEHTADMSQEEWRRLLCLLCFQRLILEGESLEQQDLGKETRADESYSSWEQTQEDAGAGDSEHHLQTQGNAGAGHSEHHVQLSRVCSSSKRVITSVY